jgi:beta-N-acetylhexosaminidase
MATIIVFLVVSSISLAEKKEGPHIRGEVTQAARGDAEQEKKGYLGSIRVEGKVEADTGYDKAQVRILKGTTIERLVGKERKKAGIDDLRKGAKVEVVFTGPVAESYPVMATANAILILE